MKTIKRKNHFIYILLLALLFTFSFTKPIEAAGRKIITKPISDSFTLWSAYTYKYSVYCSAVLTYNNSNQITQISDISCGPVNYTTGTPSLTANFIASQKSKTYSGNTARYVITISRNVYGYYSDKVDYTLSYSVSDSGSPYSIEDTAFASNNDIIVVSVSEPYDINIVTRPYSTS